jgi:glycosyltransferase involved in cell wall biosynthesis
MIWRYAHGCDDSGSNPVSVIVPTRDRAKLLAHCVDGVLHRTDYSNLELLIVDNGSIEPATQTLFDQLTREDTRVRILRHPGPFNYSALNNTAAREANGEILLLLNNDVEVIEPGWLRELASQALRPDVVSWVQSCSTQTSKCSTPAWY